jgi:hypothetical protein
MPQAIPKQIGAKKAAAAKPNLVKKEHPAVTKAKEKPLNVQESLPTLEPTEQKKIPAIHKKAIELKKLRRDRVALTAEETKMNADLMILMKAEGLTKYHVDEVEDLLFTEASKFINFLKRSTPKSSSSKGA